VANYVRDPKAPKVDHAGLKTSSDKITTLLH